jgi:hypothetical protein
MTSWPSSGAIFLIACVACPTIARSQNAGLNPLMLSCWNVESEHHFGGHLPPHTQIRFDSATVAGSRRITRFVKPPYRRRDISRWSLERDSIVATFSDGFTGVVVRFHRKSDDLIEGIGTYFQDVYPSPPNPTANVRASKVACPTSP